MSEDLYQYFPPNDFLLLDKNQKLSALLITASQNNYSILKFKQIYFLCALIIYFNSNVLIY